MPLSSNWRRRETHISAYRASDARGEACHGLRGTYRAAIPAFLITGDTTTERMHEAHANDLLLLHKPINPMALRAVVNQLLRPASANAGATGVVMAARSSAP